MKIQKPINFLARTYSATDPELIKIIKERYLIPPASSNTEYNYKPNDYRGYDKTVLEILDNKKNGFFVECGANNGVFHTNTLPLEKDFGWTGILIEAAPNQLQELYKVNRRSWIVPAGLSIKNETMHVEFGEWGKVGQILDETLMKGFVGRRESKTNPTVPLVPFYSILLALDNPTIDYFSLDVEGYELDILKTIPFDKVNIKILTVEYIHLKEKGWSVHDLETFMSNQGYVVHSKTDTRKDFIFVKKEL